MLQFKKIAATFLICLPAVSIAQSPPAKARVCAVSLAGTSETLTPYRAENIGASLQFFLVEKAPSDTSAAKIKIIPLKTATDVAAYFAGITGAAIAKDLTSANVKRFIPDSILEKYAKRLIEETTAEFLSGLLNATVWMRDGAPRFAFVGDRFNHRDIYTYLASATPPEEPLPIKAEVPFLKQDGSWGKTEIELGCR